MLEMLFESSSAWLTRIQCTLRSLLVVAAAAALAVAEEIAENPPVAVRSTKANLLYSRDHASVQEGLDYVATWNMAMLQSKEVPVAMRAALSKGGKKPTWEKL